MQAVLLVLLRKELRTVALMLQRDAIRGRPTFRVYRTRQCHVTLDENLVFSKIKSRLKKSARARANKNAIRQHAYW